MSPVSCSRQPTQLDGQPPYFRNSRPFPTGKRHPNNQQNTSSQVYLTYNIPNWSCPYVPRYITRCMSHSYNTGTLGPHGYSSLIEVRKKGLDSTKYQHVLRGVLMDLYELVGQPVTKKALSVRRTRAIPNLMVLYLSFRFSSPPRDGSNSDHMPRPSKPFKRRFSDHYIPSYAPSHPALIESRNSSAQTPDRPSLHLVAQPDDSLPGVWGEIQVM
ncbi:hypothetical protein EDB87DRAFT_1684393 [Lactarius vividus]|nr:hypothetical protein EDB87DRAFT_1684393 [Lactarius vividus]